VTEHQEDAEWNIAEWQGKQLVDRDGEKIGKLEAVYVDVENDEPMFGTVKEGRSRTLQTSSCRATSYLKRTRSPSITTTSSTTRRPPRRAVAGSPAAPENSNSKGPRD
jgi:PRC-barrel domain